MKFRHILQVSTLVLAVSGAVVVRADNDEHEVDGHRDSNPGQALPTAVVKKDVNPTVAAECGSCHMVYPAHYLPTRSWQKLMSGLEDHFGLDASLDQASTKAILEWLTSHSADHSTEKRARQINKSIGVGETPMRISETPWFKHEHDEIAKSIWSRKSIGSVANCVACHPRAEAGSFSEREIKIPK
jgi:nitrate/TMAO reductase-like tetraheme cytochrome c subunit